MDDPKDTSKPNADAGTQPKPSNGQYMDIQSPKPSSSNPNDSAPVLPPANVEEAVEENTDSDAVVTDASAEPSDQSDAASSDTTPSDQDSTPSSEETKTWETADSNDTNVAPEPAPEPAATDPTADAGSEHAANTDVADQADKSTSHDRVATTPVATESNPLAIPPVLPPKSGKPILVIAVAVIVAIGLAGLVVFTFMKTKSDTGNSRPNNSSGAAPTTKPQASPADVDATTQEIEGSLNKIDDSKDFSSTDLGDKSLGL